MKKGAILFLSMAFCLSAYSQNKKINVAVAIRMDTTFTLLGSIKSKTFDMNLSKYLYRYLAAELDTSTFDIHLESFPESRFSNEESVSLPKKYVLQPWLKELGKKKGYDWVLLLYKPVLDAEQFYYMNGLSYGMTVKDNKIFSLNDAMVFDTRNGEELAHTDVHLSSEFLAFPDKGKKIEKPMEEYTLKDLTEARRVILELNKGFISRVCQTLWSAKIKVEGKQ